MTETSVSPDGPERPDQPTDLPTDAERAAITDDVVIRPDGEQLAVFAARLFARTVAELLARQDRVDVVLTGGTIADQLHRAIAEQPGLDDVDWSRVHVWFGDERFVAADDDDRNVGQARAALLDHAPLDRATVHEVPSRTDQDDDPAAAAAAYAEELVSLRERRPGPALFDLLMLGIGPDGHCASLFPRHDEVASTEPVLAVTDSPKPPPERVTLGMETLLAASEVWFLASGEGKAAAVAAAVSAGDVRDVPARGPRGLQRTRWLLDSAAASALGR